MHFALAETIGKKRGFAKRREAADNRPKPEKEAPPDMSRFNADQLAEFERLQAISCGYANGVMPPEPEFVLRLDQVAPAGEPGEPPGAGVRAMLAKCVGNLGPRPRGLACRAAN